MICEQDPMTDCPQRKNDLSAVLTGTVGGNVNQAVKKARNQTMWRDNRRCEPEAPVLKTALKSGFRAGDDDFAS